MPPAFSASTSPGVPRCCRSQLSGCASDASWQPLAQRLQRARVVRQRQIALVPAHRHRPQVLGAHHRAHAVAPVEVAQLVGEAGVAHQVLAARADLQHADLVVAQLRADGRSGHRRVLPPQVLGRTHLRLAVLYPQVDRLRGFPLMTIASNPAILSSGPQKPPASDSP